MPAKKSKKVKKYRGSTTHGGGSMKKRRGAGNRGGRGNAGTGKRADQKKPTILKLFGNTYFGKKGFHSKTRKNIKCVNISYLENKIEFFVKQGLAESKQGIFHINLNKIGVKKLLGTGTPTKKYNITLTLCSKKAKQKVEEKGGTINVSV